MHEPSSTVCEHVHDVHHLTPEAILERIQEAKSRCHQQGVRFTALRQQIYELVLKSNKPVGAYDLITELQHARLQNDTQTTHKGPSGLSKNVAPPTVYRSLEFLLEQGLIHQLTSLNAYIPCCHPRSKHTAAFLICDKCLQVQECSTLPVQQMMDYAQQDIGFCVSQSVIELRGVCQACQNAEPA